MTAPDDVRARFEAWLAREMNDAEPMKKRNGDYMDPETRNLWLAWQARGADLSGEVRELVEADREYDAAQQVVGKAMLCEVEAEANAALKRFAAASKRRATALAKFAQQEKP